MHPRGLVDITAEMLREFRHSPLPADRVVRRFIRQKKFLGASDRRFVTDTFYHTLRHLLRIDESIRVALENAPVRDWVLRSTGFPLGEHPNDLVWSRPKDSPKRLLPMDKWFDSLRIALAAEDLTPGFVREQIIDTFVRDFAIRGGWFHEDWVIRTVRRAMELLTVHANEGKLVRYHIRYSVPEWMLGHIGHGLLPAETPDLLESLNGNAPVSLRVNTLKTSRDEYLTRLQAADLHFETGKLASDSLTGKGRVREGDLPGSQGGLVEFQDEGSQLVSEIINPQPGMRVIDACAGAGGKTLHFAARMKNEGDVLLFDSVPGRLKNGLKRCDEAGVTCARLLFDDFAYRNPEPGELADIVLVDAPCSGSGTLRRSPDLKWRVTRDTLSERIRTQHELLQRWSKWVKPGGRLAYVTCSIFHDENGARIDDFLKQDSEFTRMSLNADVSMLTRSGDIQLLPHRHGTDGFFLAILQRAT